MKVCLAKALALPVDVLVLDEPTNDLDIEAIEELAELLIEFNGLVLFVSHDRYLIDQCATETWYLTPKKIIMHPGGFAERFVSSLTAQIVKQHDLPVQEKKVVHEKPTNKSTSLKLKSLMTNIEQVEKSLADLQEKLLSPELYTASQRKELEQIQRKEKELSEKLAELYKEWERLE